MSWQMAVPYGVSRDFMRATMWEDGPATTQSFRAVRLPHSLTRREETIRIEIGKNGVVPKHEASDLVSRINLSSHARSQAVRTPCALTIETPKNLEPSGLSGR
jgi:virulence-associated protein VagC